MNNSLKKKISIIFSDSVCSITALVIMNVVAQFAVYPFWAMQFGAEYYGDILYLLSFINIFSVSIGLGMNFARLADSAKIETKNGEYHVILLIACVLGAPFSWGVQKLAAVSMSQNEFLIFWLLLCFTMWRNYADVDFRLGLNYKGYFKYYCAVSIGYLFGIVLCYFIGIWELSLLVGEVTGILYVFLKGDNLRRNSFQFSEESRATIESCMILVGTHFIMNLIFNADRFVLKAFISGTAVTIYYLSSLMGKTVSLITTPLNSVIISYLAKYKGGFSWKMYCRMLLIIGVASVIMVIGCVVGSYILIPVLYPESFEMTKEFFWISSVSQVFFFATSVLMVVLLRFAKQRYQLYINVVYAIVFLVLGIPMTKSGGIWGFSYAILFANVSRMIVTIGFGVLDQRQRRKSV